MFWGVNAPGCRLLVFVGADSKHWCGCFDSGNESELLGSTRGRRPRRTDRPVYGSASLVYFLIVGGKPAGFRPWLRVK